jgi:hypothetical protein
LAFQSLHLRSCLTLSSWKFSYALHHSDFICVYLENVLLHTAQKSAIIWKMHL